MTPEELIELRAAVHANLACADALAAKDCEAIAVIMSAGRTRLNGIDKGDFQIWLAKTGQRAVVEQHANNPASPLQSIALTIRDFIYGTVSAIQFSRSDNQSLLLEWVEGGAMSPELAQDLLSLGTVPDPLSARDISLAVFNDDGTEK